MGKLSALIVLLSASFAFAQVPDTEITSAMGLTAWIVQKVTEFDVAAEECGGTKRPEWTGVINAIDKRYRFCVTQDSTWKSLGVGFASLEAKSVAEGSGRSLGSFTFDSKRPFVLAEFDRYGKQHFCKLRPWKLWASPDTATIESKAEFVKSNPGFPIDAEISTAKFIISIGANTAWVESPCNKFFPMIAKK